MLKLMKTGLGIVFYKDRIAVSQTVHNGTKIEKSHAAEFMLPAGKAELQDLAPLAAGFRSFLKENHFTANKAVVGLEAGRIFSMLLNIPASKDQTLMEEMIRIQIERKTQLDPDNIAFGYVGCGEKTFVAAVLKSQMDQIRSFLSGAGIRAICISPAAAVIESVRPGWTGCCIIEYPESFELLFTENGQITAIRDSGAGKAANEFLPRIRKQIAQLSLGHNRHPDCMFTLCGSSSHELNGQIKLLFESAAIHTIPAVSSPSQLLKTYAQRVAEKGLNGNLPAVNFLSSMQTHRRSIRSLPWMSRAMVAAAVLVVVFFLFALEWRFDRSRIAAYKEELDNIRPNVEQAQTVIDRIAYARQWFDPQPLYLNILMELTSRFPEQGGIWLNSLAVDETLNQVITGKASGEQAVLDIVDNLKSSPLFQDVKILYIRQAGKNTREETFAISFRFIREN